MNGNIHQLEPETCGHCASTPITRGRAAIERLALGMLNSQRQLEALRDTLPDEMAFPAAQAMAALVNHSIPTVQTGNPKLGMALAIERLEARRECLQALLRALPPRLATMEAEEGLAMLAEHFNQGY